MSFDELVAKDRETMIELARKGGYGIAADRELEVPLVRVVRREEWGQTVAACVREDGFEALAPADGSLFTPDVPAEQGEALNYSVYRCQMAYPSHPIYSLPLPAEPASQLYDFWVETTAPCLEELGAAVGEVPSKEVWMAHVAEQGVEPWSPFDEVNKELDDEVRDKFYAACPQYPEGFYPI